MADAEPFQICEDFGESFGVEAFDALTAIGGDDAEELGICFEKARGERAALLFEMLEHPYLGGEAGGGIGAVVGFHHASVEGEIHGGAERILDLEHGTTWMARAGVSVDF